MKIKPSDLTPLRPGQIAELMHRLLETRSEPALVCSPDGFPHELLHAANSLQLEGSATACILKFSLQGARAVAELNGCSIDFQNFEETVRFADLLKFHSLAAKRAGLQILLLADNIHLAPPAAVNAIMTFAPAEETSSAYDAFILGAHPQADLPMALGRFCSLYSAQ